MMRKMNGLLAALLLGSAVQAQDVAKDAPPAPDYADQANWASSAASALPGGATPIAKRADVDIFYIHPTTERTQQLWNQDVRDPVANKWVDESVIARQASAFSGCCRIFAPRYRAATIKALRDNEHRDPAYAFAYADVERAFDWYLKNANKGRPFILAGHSQGALHISTLLEKRIQNSALRKQLVAAYIIGINLAEGEFQTRFQPTPICDTPSQTGCVVQWNALLDGSDVTAAAKASERAYVEKFGEVGKTTLCINPLTFRRSEGTAPASAALGAVPGDPGFGPLRALIPGAVAARCEQGMLVVTPSPALELKPLPGGSMHYHDIGLFWADLRANAVLRAKGFKARR